MKKAGLIYVLVWYVLAGVAFGEAVSPPKPEADPLAMMDALEAEIRTLPDPPAELVQHAGDVRQALVEMKGRMERAEQDSARAYARMASYTGAMLSREQKKVPTSRRLIEITERTGRSGEVERYQTRHRMLLDTIDRIARHYRLTVEHLAELDPDLVDSGFRAHEAYLIEEGLAEQILVQQTVEKHVRASRAAEAPPIEQWIEELGSI